MVVVVVVADGTLLQLLLLSSLIYMYEYRAISVYSSFGDKIVDAEFLTLHEELFVICFVHSFVSSFIFNSSSSSALSFPNFFHFCFKTSLCTTIFVTDDWMTVIALSFPPVSREDTRARALTNNCSCGCEEFQNFDAYSGFCLSPSSCV